MSTADEANKAFSDVIVREGNRLCPPDLPHEIVIQNMFGFHAYFYNIAGGYVFAIIDAQTGTLADCGAVESRSEAERELLYWLAEMWHELTVVEDDDGKVTEAFDPPEILSVREFLEIMEHIYRAERPELSRDNPEGS